MFCPQCGSTQPEELNFCKTCGAHLQAVRGALVKDASDKKFDWNQTWAADMMMSGDAKAKRDAELERLPTAEVKRRREIKAGIITLATGLSLSLVLSVIMEAIVINGHLSALAADILSRVWIVGLIPVFVGLALIVNGTLISKIGVRTRGVGAGTIPPGEPAADTNELPPVMPFSVTDGTTRHLDEMTPARKTGAR